MSLFKILGLSGDLFYSFAKFEEGSYEFHLGPEAVNGDVSDSYFVDDYIETIAKLLKLDLQVGTAENFHTLFVGTEEEGERLISMLLDAIEVDGTKINRR